MTKPLKTALLCLGAIGLLSGLAGITVAFSKNAKAIQDQLESPVSLTYGGSSASSSPSSGGTGGSSAPVSSVPTSEEAGTPVLALSNETLALKTATEGVMPSSTISCNVTGVSNNKVVWSISDPSKMSISKSVSDSDEAITVTLAKAFYGTVNLTAMSLADSTVYKTCVVSWENEVTSITLAKVVCTRDGTTKATLNVNTTNTWSESSIGSCTALNFTEEQSALVTDPTQAMTAVNVVTIRGTNYSKYYFHFHVHRNVPDPNNSGLGNISTNFYDRTDSVSGNTTVYFDASSYDATALCWDVVIRIDVGGSSHAGREMFKLLNTFYYCTNIAQL